MKQLINTKLNIPRIPIPDTHKVLLKGSLRIVLSTVMPDGYPQTTPVWCNMEGDHILINTMKRFRKLGNMRENPKVSFYPMARTARYKISRFVAGWWR